MADCGDQVKEQEVEEVEEDEANKVEYKPPAKKSIEEILEQDKDDESLRKYKEALLGGGASDDTTFFPNDPNDVILRKMSILVDGRDDEVIALDDINQLKNMNFVVKEGTKYRLKIEFNVQRKIVSGLKFENKMSRLKFTSKETYMCGSYAPRKEVHEYVSAEEEFPKGLTGRGDYKVKSQFTDDDKNCILEWQWNIQIKKDWKS